MDIDKKLKQIQLENELLKQQKLKKEIEQMDKNVKTQKMVLKVAQIMCNSVMAEIKHTTIIILVSICI